MGNAPEPTVKYGWVSNSGGINGLSGVLVVEKLIEVVIGCFLAVKRPYFMSFEKQKGVILSTAREQQARLLSRPIITR